MIGSAPSAPAGPHSGEVWRRLVRAERRFGYQIAPKEV
jgi:hypothetical protein